MQHLQDQCSAVDSSNIAGIRIIGGELWQLRKAAAGSRSASGELRLLGTQQYEAGVQKSSWQGQQQELGCSSCGAKRALDRGKQPRLAIGMQLCMTFHNHDHMFGCCASQATCDPPLATHHHLPPIQRNLPAPWHADHALSKRQASESPTIPHLVTPVGINAPASLTRQTCDRHRRPHPSLSSLARPS